MRPRDPGASRCSQLELWDYYAGHALAGLLASGAIADSRKVSVAAAAHADAMLIERMKWNAVTHIPRTAPT